jgi:hypothetical protein
MVNVLQPESIDAGTVLLVRLVNPITLRDPQGKRFTTTLEADRVLRLQLASAVPLVPRAKPQ